MSERKVLILTAHDAERGLINAIHTTLEKDNRITPIVTETPSYEKLKDRTSEWHFYADVMTVVDEVLSNVKPDIVLIPTDRYEMVLSALVVFRQNIPIAHFHAGDISFGTPDDIYRHIISMMSSLLFVQGPLEAENLANLGVEPRRIYEIGSVAFDNIVIDESETPDHPYVLVLWHPVPTNEKITDEEAISLFHRLEAILKKFPDIHIYWLPPNKEECSESILLHQTSLKEANDRVHIIERMPRPKFLGWLKNATVFISNSSSTIYEAPHLETQVLNFSVRNQERLQPEIKTGGTTRLADALAGFDLEDIIIKLGYAQKIKELKELEKAADKLEATAKFALGISKTIEKGLQFGWWCPPKGKCHYIRNGEPICGRTKAYKPHPETQLTDKVEDGDKCAFCKVKLGKES